MDLKITHILLKEGAGECTPEKELNLKKKLVFRRALKGSLRRTTVSQSWRASRPVGKEYRGISLGFSWEKMEEVCLRI